MATLQAARRQIAPAPHDDAPQLRVLTCGSVDDGKSTLLGRLLFDTDSVLEDQVAALDRESRRWGTQAEGRDYALLLDGLSAEREQGITIDVAYRYFSTRRRSFIVADTPGHEQYTRNMATGASQSELAILLVDARRGLLAQTRRHAFIAATLGIRHAVLAVNKMDLVGFDQARFDAIAAAFRAAAGPLGLASVVAIPLCAKDGDNVARRSERIGWYRGPTLLEHLETLEVDDPAAGGSFCLPVQLVARPNEAFRGYAGTIAAGQVRAGAAVVALPSGQAAEVARIVTPGGDRAAAGAGEAVTLVLDRPIDVSRGDVLAAAAAPPAVGTRLTATLLWMDERALAPGRDYALRLGPAAAGVRLGRVEHAVDVNTFERRPAAGLGLNEIGRVELLLDRKLAAAPYRENRAIGSLIVIDRVTHQTVGMGVVEAVGAAAPARPRWPWGLAGQAALSGAALAGLGWVLTNDVVSAAALGGANVLISAASLLLWGRSR